MAKERRDKKNRRLRQGEYQRGDGRYMYRYTDVKGDTKFVYSWTLTQADRSPQGKPSGKCLRELEREIAKDVQDGIDTQAARRLTLNAFWDDYFAQKHELKPSTRANYRYMFDHYVRGDFGKRKLSDIKYTDVKRFYNSFITEKEFSPRSMEIIHTMLHPVFDTAVRDECIRTNPTNGVMTEIKKSHNWEQDRRHALTTAQQTALLDYVRDHKTFGHWLSLITVLLGTGCRVGEIVGLRWEDCNFQNKIIEINHALIYRPSESSGKCTFQITTPKTKAGIREIPMLSAVHRVLTEERVRQMRDGFNLDVVDGYSGFIFSNKHGHVMNPHNINRALVRIIHSYNVKETGQAAKEHREPVLLPHFSVHNLRHTFCTRLCENETNLKVIQEIMGHADITTTMNIYNESTREQKQQSFANLESKIKIC